MSETITDRVRAAIDASGLTQAEIARRVGVERQTVGDWYHGRSINIRPEHLFALADTLGIEARWLATGKGPKLAIKHPPMDYAEALSRLSPEARRALLVLLDEAAR
jgi:transcriptional regulator with XRE-family HTH domain